MVWGTDVSINRCKEVFKRFVETYVDTSIEADEKFDSLDVERPIYEQRLNEVTFIKCS